MDVSSIMDRSALMRCHAQQELLPWDLRCFYQLQVSGDVFFEKGAELRKCHRHRIYINRRQAPPHGRQCQRLHHLVVQFLSDGVRSLSRKIGACVEWIHRVTFKSGLDHCRGIGGGSETRRRADCEWDELAVTD